MACGFVTQNLPSDNTHIRPSMINQEAQLLDDLHRLVIRASGGGPYSSQWLMGTVTLGWQDAPGARPRRRRIWFGVIRSCRSWHRIAAITQDGKIAKLSPHRLHRKSSCSCRLFFFREACWQLSVCPGPNPKRSSRSDESSSLGGCPDACNLRTVLITWVPILILGPHCHHLFCWFLKACWKRWWPSSLYCFHKRGKAVITWIAIPSRTGPDPLRCGDGGLSA